MSSANFTKWEVAGTRLGEGLCNPPKAVGPLCTYVWVQMAVASCFIMVTVMLVSVPAVG